MIVRDRTTRRSSVAGSGDESVEQRLELGQETPDRGPVEAASIVVERDPELRSRNQSPEDYTERAAAGTVADHVDRFSRLADAGVDTVIVSLADVGIDDSVSEFGAVIEALSA